MSNTLFYSLVLVLFTIQKYKGYNEYFKSYKAKSAKTRFASHFSPLSPIHLCILIWTVCFVYCILYINKYICWLVSWLLIGFLQTCMIVSSRHGRYELTSRPISQFVGGCRERPYCKTNPWSWLYLYLWDLNESSHVKLNK